MFVLIRMVPRECAGLELQQDRIEENQLKAMKAKINDGPPGLSLNQSRGVVCKRGRNSANDSASLSEEAEVESDARSHLEGMGGQGGNYKSSYFLAPFDRF
jgi:hypothetical protein